MTVRLFHFALNILHLTFSLRPQRLCVNSNPYIEAAVSARDMGSRYACRNDLRGCRCADAILRGRALGLLLSLTILRARLAVGLATLAADIDFELLDADILLGKPLAQCR